MKNKANMCWEFGLVNSTIQSIWKKCVWTERFENNAVWKAWTKWCRL